MTDLYFQTLRSRPRALLQSTGLGVDVTQKEHGSKALILASNNGNEKVVRLLLNDEEVDVNFQDNDGATALYYASHNGQVEVVRALLEHDRVNVNIQDNDGDTALLLASEKGHLEVVRALLNHDGVDVNLPDMDGKTALIVASEFGHFEVVCALLNHEGVNVNIQDNDARTALIWARRKGHSEVVRALLNQEGVDVNVRDKYGYTALKVARMRPEDCAAHLLEENMKRVKLLEENNPAGTGANHLEPRYPPRRNENSSSNDDTKVEEQQKHREEEERKLRKVETSWASFKVVSDKDAKFEPDRSKLLHVMNTPSADPAELSLEYIERCIKKNHKLGSGGYGDGFLAEDSCLPKKFAVKMIRTNTKCNEADIKEMRRCFQMELSILKRFRHPNIIVFYGYSLTANSTQQCLVYEYAANGSLAGFFTENGKRDQLSSDTRLSIMFELTRAVHFLHNGGCKVEGKGWKVFHRDIKSANICLADDFTPRLIDCGLAKFVPDANSSATPGPLTVSLRNNTDGLVFGTPGYMCPEYIRKKWRGLPCPYIAAYDVFSIGVVLVELILGCLNDPQRHDVFGMYVQDERGRLVVDGLQKLKRNADRTIIWNPASLDLICKAAIQCMDPFPQERLNTKDLLDKLRDAINLNTNAGIQHPDAASAVDNGPYCHICNNYRTDIKCSEGHVLCAFCIVERLGDYSGCQLLCLVKECSSKLQDTDLYGRIPFATYNQYVKKRVERQI